MKEFTIFYDSLTELNWFQGLSNYFSDAKVELIKDRVGNPEVINELVKYDKPDIILLYDGKPVLVLEKTTEVPTGHNVGQRFARLVRSIEKNVLTIFYFPFDAKKHGKYAGICNMNIRLLEASFKMEEIHNTPLLSVDWLTDSEGEIITDGRENERLSIIINDFIKSGFDKYSNEIIKQLNYMKKEYERRLDERPSYGNFPNSVKRYKTDEFCEEFNVKNCSKEFNSRNYTYLYKIGMSPSKCKRQDPYTGTQFIYDYMACRNGEKVYNKKNNLVLYFPKITGDVWFEKNPNDPSTKSCNWYLTANALLFKDGIYFNDLKNTKLY